MLHLLLKKRSIKLNFRDCLITNCLENMGKSSVSPLLYLCPFPLSGNPSFLFFPTHPQFSLHLTQTCHPKGTSNSPLPLTYTIQAFRQIPTYTFVLLGKMSSYACRGQGWLLSCSLILLGSSHATCIVCTCENHLEATNSKYRTSFPCSFIPML